MAAPTLDQVLAQAEALPPADQLTLLARLAERVRIVYTLAPNADREKLSIDEHLARANYTGGRLFKTVEEVDAYIREERDSWER